MRSGRSSRSISARARSRVLAPVSLAALYAEEACVQARFHQDEVEAIAAAMGCPSR
jgi:hypothetical protein